MNIAIFASAFYPHFGGVEEACRNLALEYGRRGHQVTIITSRYPATLPAQENIQGVDVWRFAFELPRGSASGLANFARQFPKDMGGVLRLLREKKIDVIHVQCVGSNGFYALWAARLSKLPLVVTTQGERTMDAGKLYQKSITANWTLKQLLMRASYVTACSEADPGRCPAVCRLATFRQKPPHIQWHFAGRVRRRAGLLFASPSLLVCHWARRAAERL